MKAMGESIMKKLLSAIDRIFEPARNLWEKKSTHRRITGLLAVLFIIALLVIELNRQGLLPGFLAAQVPVNHYMAINLAFTCLLILEVIGLIFTLPSSMSRALGKQIEILSLIFLRSCFKELALLPEPVTVDHHMEVLWHILSYGAGAITIFALLGIYTRMLQQFDPTSKPRIGTSLYNFVTTKKAVALVMLFIFCAMGAWNGWLLFSGQPTFDFFQYFYTVLIFNDILLVLIAHSFLPEFRSIFRNSGYALATLLIRLALTAPVYYNVLIGISSAVFAIILTWIYNSFYRPSSLKPDNPSSSSIQEATDSQAT